MKNKKRNYTLVAILLAVVALGIGYATATTLLTVNGTATALPSDGADLEMSSPQATGGQSGTTASVDSQDASQGQCTVVLKTAGESATCTYTVGRTSGMDAGVDVTNLTATVYDSTNAVWDNTNDQWFTIATNLNNVTTLSNGDTTTLTITVTLKKANLTGANVSETFTVKVDGEADNA